MSAIILPPGAHFEQTLPPISLAKVKKTHKDAQETKKRLEAVLGDNATLRAEATELRQETEMVRAAFSHATQSYDIDRKAAKQANSELSALRVVHEQTKRELNAANQKLKRKGFFQTLSLFRRKEKESPHSPPTTAISSATQAAVSILHSAAMDTTNPNRFFSSNVSTMLPELDDVALADMKEVIQSVGQLRRDINTALHKQEIDRLLSLSNPHPPSALANTPLRNVRILVALYDAYDLENAKTCITEMIQSVPRQSQFTCPICLEVQEQGTRIEGCCHPVCQDCIKGHVTSQVQAGVWPVSCPTCVAQQTGAPSVVSRSLVDELGLESVVLDAWFKTEKNHFYSQITCPLCSKDSLIPRDLTSREVTCTRADCKQRFCSICLDRIPLGSDGTHTCSDVAFEKLKTEQKWAKCPGPTCGAIVERTEGCDNMSCRCGMYFCYNCSKSIDGHIPCYT